MELNKEQIIKALEWAIEKEFCSNCLCTAYGESIVEFYKEILSLIKELTEEKSNLEYTLMGVMHSVDKWLEGAELEQDEVNRAATMREKTLQIVEKLTEENERLRAENGTLEIYNKDYKYRLKGLRKDNEEWEEQCKDLELDNDILRERITEVKADTVRKMQERLKQHYVVDADDGLYGVLDQIAKEILNESK